MSSKLDLHAMSLVVNASGNGPTREAFATLRHAYEELLKHSAPVAHPAVAVKPAHVDDEATAEVPAPTAHVAHSHPKHTGR